jgi:hypothetical protein
MRAYRLDEAESNFLCASRCGVPMTHDCGRVDRVDPA